VILVKEIEIFGLGEDKMEIITIIILAAFLIGLAIAYWFGSKAGSSKRDQYWEGELPNYRKDAIMKSRAVLGGQFSEQLAPYLPNFDYLPTECKFIGKPIDFIVFKGMDEKNIEEVIFVEVKSGKAILNTHEKNLRDTIQKKRVKWVEYRIPEELTKKGELGDKINEVINGTSEHFCESCGRLIKHRGKCLACNMKAKRGKK
jgi:predicted Holliday junction resolvase-like endonuclease